MSSKIFLLLATLLGICFGLTIRDFPETSFRKPGDNVNIPITLVFDGIVLPEEKNKTYIILTHPTCKNLTFTNITNAKDTNLNFIEYTYPARDVNCFGDYNVIFVENGIQNDTGYKFYIFQNEMDLANPKDRYFMIEDNPREVSASFQFAASQASEAIQSISCMNSINRTEIFPITKFYVNDQHLEVYLNSRKTYADYYCDIYPRYGKGASLPSRQQFKIGFHEYLLKSEAVYLDKLNDNQNILFYLNFKEDFIYSRDSESLVIKDGENIVDYKLPDGTDRCTKCTIQISPGRKNYPATYSIFFKKYQERALFYILYDNTYFDQTKCHYKAEKQLLTIFFYWSNDMVYPHHVYFNQTTTNDNELKSIQYRIVKEEDSFKIANYSISPNSMNIGLFSLQSSIPALNYTTIYNPVNPDRLYLSIISDISPTSSKEITLYKNSYNRQFINMSFNEPDTVASLNEITFQEILLNNVTRFTLSKGKECDSKDSTFYNCDLTEKIASYPINNIIGTYSVKFADICQNLADISNLKLHIKLAYNVISFFPTWFNETKVNGSKLTLIFDNDISDRAKIRFIMIRNRTNDTIINYQRDAPNIDINYNRLTITLDYLNKGIYHVDFDSDYDIFYQVKHEFKVSNDNITFNFSHHYFVLDSGGENKLEINVINETNDFNCTLLSSINQIITNYTCKYFKFEFNKTGIVNFSYYDNDDFLIPIPDNITIVKNYLELFYFSPNPNCFYYKFNFSLIRVRYNVSFFVFLINKNEGKYLPLYNDNNIISYDIDSSYLNGNYTLYVSDETKDEVVYLYKSDIKFTNISVPEYIMKPNLYLYFHNVTCDLSGNRFIMYKNKTKEQRTIQTCIYTNENKLLCNITPGLYNNDPFGYYYFTINERSIINDTNETQLTFVSNRLNDSDFVLQKYKKGLEYNISIQLKNNDFYFPLLSYLNNSLLTSSKKEIIKLNRNEGQILFDDVNKTIKFNISLNLSDSYIIGNLTRKKEEYENFDESFYYNFNQIINNTLFTVSPTIFAYHEKKNYYEITISYSLEEDKKSFSQTKNLSCWDNTYNYERYERNCYLNLSDNNFNDGSAQNFLISIGNGEKITTQAISFIYYELAKGLNVCTKTEEMSVLINVSFPEKDFKDKLKISCESCTNTVPPYINNDNSNYNLYNLTWKTDNILESTLYLYINNDIIIHQFNMKEIGLNIYPMYIFSLTNYNNENNIYLFSTDNQRVRVTFSTSEYFIPKIDEIQGFRILKNNKPYKDFNFDTIYATTLDIIFDLSDENPGTYGLYYIDKCNNSIITNLRVEILNYTIHRNYFVLDNNNKGQSTQTMSLSINSNNKMDDISVFKNNNNNPVKSMNYDESNKKYNFILDKSSAGNYTFEVYYKGVRSKLKDIVYVRENHESFFNITGQPESCLYHQDIIKEININIKKSSEIVKGLSVFSSYWRSNARTVQMGEENGNNNDKNFKIQINDANIINQSYYIIITENNDISQPIYVLSYKYTNITLNKEYTTLLYTDTSYIEFGMACKLPGNLNFSLNNSTRNLNFECDGMLSIYDNSSNIFRCQLYINGPESRNNLIKNNIKSGEYDLIYDFSRSYIIQKNIFLSYDIRKINFSITYEEPVVPKKNLTVTLKADPNEFYMPNISSVRYYEGSNRNEEFDTKINTETLKKGNPNFTCSIYIKKNTPHFIYKVCRKECLFCVNTENCVEIPSSGIQSDIPEVYFNFDKHYINLDNDPITRTVHIKVSEDADLVERIYYNYTSDGNNFKTEQALGITKYDYYFLAGKVGKYMFMYKANTYKYNITIQNEMVFVVNHFSDLINFHNDSDGCLYYKKTGDKGILAYMTIQDNYIFKNDVPISYFDLYIDYIRFPYTKDYGYQIVQEYENNFNYNEEQPKEIAIIENNVNPETYIFGKITNMTITSFDIDMPTNESFFYKDNIVLKNIHCNLQNIYIQPLTDLNVRHSPLVCEYSREKGQSFCNASSYTFDNHYSDDVELFIGYKSSNISNTVFDIEQSILIYNSIVNSDFTMYYKYPNLTIFSNNFLMNLTESLKIDGRILRASDFESVFEKYILIKFSKNLTEFNYLSEISRFPHEKDRNEILPPRTKYLNISIVNCDKYQKFYEGKCRSCLEISFLSGQPLNLWFQDGDCFPSCTAPYAIYDSLNHYCAICKETTKIGDLYWCGCLEGTVKLEEDNVCYLPESDEIQNAALRRPNIFCYRTNGDFNYCNNTNTDRCEVISISGHDFPLCHCKNGTFGKYCEKIENTTLDLESSNLDPILDEMTEDQINANSSSTISKIRGLIFFFETDVEYTYVKNISKTKINTYINATIETMDSCIKRQSASFQMYDVIELGIYFLTYNIRNSQQESVQTYQNQLNYILDKAHYLNYLSNKDKTSFNVNSDGLNLISFISYRKDAIDVSFKNLIKQENDKTDIIGFIDLMNINSIPKSEVLVITIINKLLFSYTNQRVGRNLESNDNLTISSNDGVIIKFSSNNKETRLSTLKDFSVYVHSSNLNVNYDLANYYQQYNIGIYNLYDECFVEPCYFNKRLDYDLTQKYRKKYLYQKLLLNSEKCSYNSFDIDINNIKFYCPEFDSTGFDENGTEYGYLNFTFKHHRIENENKNYKLLPIKCTKKIDDIKDNLAFRIFFAIIGIELIYIIIINIFSCDKLRNFSMIAGLENDKVFKFSRNSKKAHDAKDSNTTQSDTKNSNDNKPISNKIKVEPDDVENKKNKKKKKRR